MQYQSHKAKLLNALQNITRLPSLFRWLDRPRRGGVILDLNMFQVLGVLENHFVGMTEEMAWNGYPINFYLSMTMID